MKQDNQRESKKASLNDQVHHFAVRGVTLVGAVRLYRPLAGDYLHQRFRGVRHVRNFRFLIP